MRTHNTVATQRAVAGGNICYVSAIAVGKGSMKTFGRRNGVGAKTRWLCAARKGSARSAATARSGCRSLKHKH